MQRKQHTNPLMAEIHNLKLRMPFILPKEIERDWLDNDLNEKEIAAMIKPFDENQREAFTISTRITNRNENPDQAEVQYLFEYPELAMFD
ncbi:MAG: SOS response-associated peptidase family protein [Bacteroidia bacterium]